MDRLSPFLANFAICARVFYSGRLCGSSGNHDSHYVGHLHVLRRGRLKIVQAGGTVRSVDEPSVLFYPRPCRHRFVADRKHGAELVCATVEFGAGMLNPLMEALPDILIVPLDRITELSPTIDLFFAEAFGERPGRQTAVDRLAEYFLVLLLRAAIDARLVSGGLLLGLADQRLAHAIHAMHERPDHAWSLEELARLSGMSRARFAVRFRETVGMTPFEYLTGWRIGVAQTLLRKGEPLKIVAPAVGFTNPSALSRAFSQRLGLSPTQWLSRTSTAVPADTAKRSGPGSRLRRRRRI